MTSNQQIAEFDARQRNPDITLYWDNPEYQEAYNNARLIGEAGRITQNNLALLENFVISSASEKVGIDSQLISKAKQQISNIRKQWGLPVR